MSLRILKKKKKKKTYWPQIFEQYVTVYIYHYRMFYIVAFSPVSFDIPGNGIWHSMTWTKKMKSQQHFIR